MITSMDSKSSTFNLEGGLKESVLMFLKFSVFLCPILATYFYSSMVINIYSAYLFVLFAVMAFWVGGCYRSRFPFSNVKVLLGLCVLTVLPVVWYYSGDLSAFGSRLAFLVGAFLLFACFYSDSERAGKAFVSIVTAKAFILVGVAIYFLVYIYLLPEIELVGQGVLADPPLYNHLRHLNYDLFFAIPILVFLMNRKDYNGFFVLALLSTAVVAVWTGGRGMFLSLLVVAFLVKLRDWVSTGTVCSKTDVVCVSIFILAFIVVMATGKANLLVGAADRTMARETVNAISSGRLTIWWQSLRFFSGLDTLNQVFGLGPDAFVNFRFYFKMGVHPHNVFVQVLLEYGILGFLVFFSYLLIAIKKCFVLLFDSKESVDALAASLVVGGVVFSLVDGIFYHATALITMLVLLAFVEFRYISLRESLALQPSASAVL